MGHTSAPSIAPGAPPVHPRCPHARSSAASHVEDACGGARPLSRAPSEPGAMLKALKKGIKKLGSGTKLQEAAGAPDAAAAPAAAAPKAGPVHPSGLPRPPSPLAQQQTQQQQQEQPPAQQPQPLPPAAAAAEGSARPASPPLHEELGGGMVDYELVAGPLELDTADEGEASAGPSCSYGTADGVARGVEQHSAEGAEQLGRVCYGSGDQSGSLAAAAAAQDEAAAAEGGGSDEQEHGGDGDDAGAAADGTSAAAAAAAGGGGEISEALAAMMYLTEDAEGNDDCVSVVSGGSLRCEGAKCRCGSCSCIGHAVTALTCCPLHIMCILACPLASMPETFQFSPQLRFALFLAEQTRSVMTRTSPMTSASSLARWRHWRARRWLAPAPEASAMWWCCALCKVATAVLLCMVDADMGGVAQAVVGAAPG